MHFASACYSMYLQLQRHVESETETIGVSVHEWTQNVVSLMQISLSLHDLLIKIRQFQP